MKDSDASKLPVRERVIRGVARWGALALVSIPIAVVKSAVSFEHSLTSGNAHYSVVAFVPVALLSCLATGAVSGMLLPLGATWVGSVLVSACYFFPMGMVILVLLRDVALTDPGLYFGSAIGSVTLGLLYGTIEWKLRDE